MRKFFISIAVLTAFQVQAQISWNQTYQQYINQYKDIAIEQMQRYHIPASITLAQGLFESGAGRSELARKGNNHFGIKCNGWSGRGAVAGSITMTTIGMSASVPMAMPTSRMRTIQSSLQAASVIVRYSS